MTIHCILPCETPTRSYKDRVKTGFSSFEMAPYTLRRSGKIQRHCRMKQKGWNTPDNSRNHVIPVSERVTQGHPDSVTQTQHSTNTTGMWPEVTNLLIPLQSKSSFSEAWSSLRRSVIWLDLPS